MSEQDLKALLEKSVDEVLKQIDELTLPQLVALHNLEAAQEKPRSTLLAKILDEFAVRDERMANADATVADLKEALKEAETEIESLSNEDGSAKEKAGEQVSKKAPWKEVDYSGPLTGEQADWRNKNLKDDKGSFIEQPDTNAETK